MPHAYAISAIGEEFGKCAKSDGISPICNLVALPRRKFIILRKPTQGSEKQLPKSDHKRSLRISRANHASSFFFCLSVYVITLEEMIIIVYQRFRKSC